MGARYIDIPATVQVLGSIYLNPSLLDNEKYHFNEEDFPNSFHRILFGTIHNLHILGANEINDVTIENYLEQRPKMLAEYKVNKGSEYLQELINTTQIAAFDYYYHRIKKMTLFRMYKEKAGMDLSYLYDIDNIFDQKKKQAQEDWLDSHTEEEIAETIDQKIESIKLKYIDNADTQFSQAGDGALELLEQLKRYPEIGVPLYGNISNYITRGARLGKFYLRSAATGVGKSRAMIADACTIGCDEIYRDGVWQNNGVKEPVLFISTEQQKDEIQTMMISFLSDVNEAHILYNQYEAGEWERVIYAADVLKKSPIQIKTLPDFSLQDIENAIKFSIREYKARYIFFDYIHSSMKILSEVTGRAGVKGLREDNVLFMISVKLKDICVENGVFIESSTQLNGDYRDAKIYDQNLLRGAKSIADKIDLGEIMLGASPEDIESLRPFLNQNGLPVPDTKISIYKNRRGRYKDVLIWCVSDKGTCKITPKFVTDYQYQIIKIPELEINVINNPAEEEGYVF